MLVALLTATAVAARISDTALAAHQIAFQVWIFLALTVDAIAIAGQAMVGRFLGADDPPAARSAARRMLEWGVLVGSVCVFFLLAFRALSGSRARRRDRGLAGRVAGAGFVDGASGQVLADGSDALGDELDDGEADRIEVHTGLTPCIAYIGYSLFLFVDTSLIPAF